MSRHPQPAKTGVTSALLHHLQGHDPKQPDSRTPNRKKTGLNTPLSCKNEFFLSADQTGISDLSGFFTNDDLSILSLQCGCWEPLAAETKRPLMAKQRSRGYALSTFPLPQRPDVRLALSMSHNWWE